MIDHGAVHLALRAHALPALPAVREFENIELVPPPAPGTPYVEEDYVPATATLLGLVRGGPVEETALYVLRWYAPAGGGVKDLNAKLTALLQRFAPGTAITADDGTIVRVRADVAPTRSQITNDGAGWAVSTVTIPVRMLSHNTPT